MTKILHILATPRAEGTPNLVLDWLATGMHMQEVFVLHSQPDDLAFSLRTSAQWYAEAPPGLLDGWKHFPHITTCVRHVCLERAPDLVICWVLGLAGWVCLGAKLAGVKNLLVHAGNPPSRGFRHDWITRYVNWPLWVLGARVVCCSRYVCEQMRSVPYVPGGLFHVVHNCSRTALVRQRAAAARQAKPPDSRLCGLMVATLERHKDHETVLLALPRVLEERPLFQIYLAGDGSLRTYLYEKVQQLGLGHAVHFLGSRSDIPELLGQVDLFVFSTTEQEGLGSVLLEALAAGLPVVASDVPACRELLQEGRWGVLAPAGNPEAFATAILQVLASPPQMEVRIKEVESYLNHFTPQGMIEKYLCLASMK